jgi:glycosyltransferase involved in cell wall biosynthesis
VESKRHIALVTTWFPPQQSVATNRMLAFVEFLSENYTVTVFALGPHAEIKKWSDNVEVHYFRARSIVDKLRSKQTDHRIIHLSKTAAKVLMSKVTKDPLSRWQTEVTKSLFLVHEKRPFDLVISSFAPQETHLATAGFVRENKGVKWIADMRDEMSMNPGLNDQQKARMRQIELLVDKYAAAITSVSDPIVQDFKRLCPNVRHFEEIRNGFNHNLINDHSHKNEVFTFGYFGSFYGGRKPVTFFAALEALKKEHPDFQFEFHIVGAHRNFDIPSGLSSFVKFLPPLPYQQAIEKMMTMDANLVLHPRSEQKGVFTGKLFDYISVNQPVIACVDKDDVAAKLVNELNIGYVAECTDLSENKTALWQAYQDWKNGNIKHISEEQRMAQHRKTQVGKMQELIETLLKK